MAGMDMEMGMEEEQEWLNQFLEGVREIDGRKGETQQNLDKKITNQWFLCPTSTEKADPQLSLMYTRLTYSVNIHF